MNNAYLSVLVHTAAVVAMTSGAPRWDGWKPWAECSVTCGVGTMTRDRVCFDGPCEDDNEGDGRQSKDCFRLACAADDSAVETWSEWGTCTSRCVGRQGFQYRWRECKIGHACTDSKTETQSCSGTTNCPVDGGWTEWSEWSGCSATCGEGHAYRKRTCSNPTPGNNGALCGGADWETAPCYARNIICYRSKEWGPWSDWQAESRSGGGKLKKTRMCLEHYPTDPNSLCVGVDTKTKGGN